jgi:CheY-like chemotaxis protein
VNWGFEHVSLVLIVDDKEDNRQLLKQLLKPLGFELREAGNGQEALDIWDSWEPHLIWMDMRMPVMDGYKATEQIKASTRGQATAIIALTASAFDEEKAIVLSAGCNDFLRKPFRETEIFDMMHKHLGVQYVYEKAPDAEAGQGYRTDVLNVAALLALPEDLRDDLWHSVEAVDTTTLSEVIKRIYQHNQLLAEAIAKLMDSYRFDLLQTLFEELEDNLQAEQP